MFFLPSARVAHSTVGRWITGPPTLSSYISVRTSSFWPPAWSICSISLLDSSFSLRAFGAYQGCHTETIGRRDSAVHTRTLCENKGQLNKTKQSVMTLVEQDDLDDMLLNRSILATKKKKAEGYCFLGSPETDPSSVSIREQTERKTPSKARSWA